MEIIRFDPIVAIYKRRIDNVGISAFKKKKKVVICGFEMCIYVLMFTIYDLWSTDIN